MKDRRPARVLFERWTPWLLNLSLALVARALLPVDLATRGERYTYYGMSRVFPLSTCGSFHCFRFVPPLFTALVPGEIADRFIVTGFVFQVLAGVVLWNLTVHLSQSRRLASLTTVWYWVTWAPILALSDPLLITDPIQAFWCLATLHLLITGRYGLAVAMLVAGAGVKESVLLVPPIYAAYVALTEPRVAWKPIRLGVCIAAPIVTWVGVRVALQAHGYSMADDVSYLRQTYFLGVWLKGLAPWPHNLLFAALYVFGSFGAAWILGAIGLLQASRSERALAIAAAPAMICLALYQVPDRALATFPYAVLIPAARVVSAWPALLTAALMIANAAFTIRMNAAPRWLPSSTALLAALAVVIAAGIWTSRTSAPKGPAHEARPNKGDEVATLSAAALVIALALVAAFLWRASHIAPIVPLSVPDEIAVVDDDAATPAIALSLDERSVVFVGRDSSGVRGLWRQDLGSTEPVALKGTNGASAPFWAPDGDRIGFFAEGALKTVDLRSSDVKIVADAPAPRGGTWGAHDVIVFAPSERGGLSEVSAIGGTPAPITALDAATGQLSHQWPSFLPDGERFFFSARESEGREQTVYLGSLTTADVKRVGDHMNNATFADGFLVYIREDQLFARPFDLRRQLALGTERKAMKPVAFSVESARGAFAIHGRTLVYAPTTSRARSATGTLGRQPSPPFLIVDDWRSRLGSP
jgi:hypothetical protein